MIKLKYLMLLLGMISLVLLTQSCDKEDEVDPCESVICENDGTCLEGSCNCPDGFTGEFCETVLLPVQNRLDAGETPIEIYNSDNILLDSLYGKTYAGGLIFYLDTTDGSGIVAAPVDQSATAVWGCEDDYIEIGGTSSEIGTGQTNTSLIVSSCLEVGIAARLCDDLDSWGYNDWFFPSKDELNLMWENLADSDGDGENTGTSDPNNIGSFSSSGYWSSTEGGILSAATQSFSNGWDGAGTKSVSWLNTRAVRTF